MSYPIRMLRCSSPLHQSFSSLTLCFLLFCCSVVHDFHSAFRTPKSAIQKRPLYFAEAFKIKSRQRPTLPQETCSTIGAGKLNFRVRDGNGCFLSAIATGKAFGSIKIKK